MTDFGHLVSRPRPGEGNLLSEVQIAETLDALLHRLASELGVSVLQLRGEAPYDPESGKSRVFVVGPYVSFRAEGAALPASAYKGEEAEDAAAFAGRAPPTLGAEEGTSGVPGCALTAATAGAAAAAAVGAESGSFATQSAPPSFAATAATLQQTEQSEAAATRELRPEWSEEWCKPRPGMLLAAMAACRVGAPDGGLASDKVLMIGADYVDEEAAHHAKVAYMPFQHLVQTAPSSASYFHCFKKEHVGDYLVAAGAPVGQTRAPGSFASEQHKRKQEKQAAAHQKRAMLQARREAEMRQHKKEQ